MAAVIILVTAILILVNRLLYNYPLVSFPAALFGRSDLYLSCLLYIAGFLIEKMSLRFSLMLKTIGMVYLLAIVMLIADAGFFTTPFPVRDLQVMHIDHWLGFHVLAVVDIMQHYPRVGETMRWFYYLLFIGIIAVPMLLAVFKQTVTVYRYMLACLWACLIGYLIYYFFPTSDPASVMHSPYFLSIQKHIPEQFIKNHHYVTSVFYRAGYIGLPSFHTIWAMLLVFAAWRNRFFGLICALFSFGVILSTLTTGWHFLLDDVAGVIVASASWFLAVKMTRADKPLLIKSEKR